MSIINAGGPKEERTTNIIKPGDVVERPDVDPSGPTIIVKPDAVPFRPLPKPKPLPLLRKGAINIAGEDSNRDFVSRPTEEDILRIKRADAEGKRWAAMQPPSRVKIYDQSKLEPWPYAIKLDKPAPGPDLKFNPETFTYISGHVKDLEPYGVVKEKPRILVPMKAENIRHIAIKPGNYFMAQPPNSHFLDQGGHIVSKPR